MFVGMTVNQYGTAVSRHRCDACGDEFTVCPSVDDVAWGGACLAEGCPSYDESRDIDKVWDAVQGVVKRREYQA